MAVHSTIDIREPLLATQQEDSDNGERAQTTQWSLLFGWVYPSMLKGSKQSLQMPDLPALPTGLDPACNVSKLKSQWRGHHAPQQPVAPGISFRSGEGQVVRRSLLKCCFTAFGGQYLAIGLLKLVSDALNFAGPLILDSLMRQLQQSGSGPSNNQSQVVGGDASSAVQYAQVSGQLQANAAVREVNEASAGIDSTYAGDGPLSTLPAGLPGALAWFEGFLPPYLRLPALLGLTCVAKALLNSHYNYQLRLVTCKLRCAVVGLLHDKVLSVRSGERRPRFHFTISGVESKLGAILTIKPGFGC